MTDKAVSEGSSGKQKATIGTVLIVLGLIGWQVYGMFGGGGEGSSPETPVSAGGSNGSMQPMTPPKASPPKQAKIVEQKPLSEREKQLLQLQEATQAKYIEAMNELKLLKLSAQIIDTNKGISEARLAIVKNQKEVIDLLTPPAKPEATASTYAQGLAGGRLGGEVMGIPSQQEDASAMQAPMAQPPYPGAQQGAYPQSPSSSRQVSTPSAPSAPTPLSEAEREKMMKEMSITMRNEYERLSADMDQKQKDAFLRMDSKSKEEFTKLSVDEQKEFIQLPPEQQKAFVELPKEEKEAFITLPPQQKEAFVKLSSEEKEAFIKMPPTEKQKIAEEVAPKAASATTEGKDVVLTAYTVVSVAQLHGTWTAVIGGANTLFSVQVGDVLPPDGSVVKRIDKDGLTLDTNGVIRKISMVPII